MYKVDYLNNFRETCTIQTLSAHKERSIKKKRKKRLKGKNKTSMQYNLKIFTNNSWVKDEDLNRIKDAQTDNEKINVSKSVIHSKMSA